MMRLTAAVLLLIVTCACDESGGGPAADGILRLPNGRAVDFPVPSLDQQGSAPAFPVSDTRLAFAARIAYDEDEECFRVGYDCTNTSDSHFAISYSVAFNDAEGRLLAVADERFPAPAPGAQFSQPTLMRLPLSEEDVVRVHRVEVRVEEDEER